MSTDATTPQSPSPATPTPAVFDPAKLPDDTSVLKQMIAELLAALKRDRRELAEVQQRLDALLRRGRPGEPIDPNQPLLFPELAQPEPAAPAPPAAETESSQRGKSKPHGRRRPARQLRREPRRYELPTLERLCPECGTLRHEIGVLTTEQYDYKPAECVCRRASARQVRLQMLRSASSTRVSASTSDLGRSSAWSVSWSTSTSSGSTRSTLRG